MPYYILGLGLALFSSFFEYRSTVLNIGESSSQHNDS
uniref:Uncharacterized protein n=1 Tax=Anguilla anguilla TaxID=7936 RepID=A0A0E9U8M5_ANGAN